MLAKSECCDLKRCNGNKNVPFHISGPLAGKRTFADITKHRLVSSELLEGLISGTNKIQLTRWWLQNIAAEHPCTHRSQGIVQEAKEALIRLRLLEILHDLKGLNRTYVDHHCVL